MSNVPQGACAKGLVLRWCSWEVVEMEEEMEPR
jgi:hypothetical protein